jgi:hypothetical protein
MVFGLFGGLIISVLGESALKLETAFTQLNLLIPLGIIIGVMYEIRRSGGTRSINLPIVLVGALYFFAWGLLGFSKEGMLLPLVCWFFPVCALRFRLSVMQVLSILAVVFVVFYWLVPYAQYGRSFLNEGQTQGQKLAIAMKLLEHPDETRKTYNEIQNSSERVAGAYYNTPQGFWDRLQFISIDDTMINITDQGKVFGLLPIKLEILNTVPHILWPDKPNANFGNFYAHEAGLGLSPDDTTTGISFSPTAEAYHMAKWTGVLVIAPLLWFLVFVIYDSLFGDVRESPWGLLAMSMFAHAAPESQLTGVVHLITFGTEILVFCAFFATWVAPVLASTVLGPDRRKAGTQISFQPTH